MRYVLKVAYDGTAYCGWQVQNNGNTIQAELMRAAREVCGQPVTITASGRTDAGVHAAAQICHADIPADIPAQRLADALNCKLPPDISVLASAPAPEGFDANRSAKRKTYRYSLYCSPRRNPLADRYAQHIKGEIDIDALSFAAKLFCGEHDFKAYCASGSKVQTTVRTIYSAEVYKKDGIINFDVCGSGFLYNMVRTMVGTALGYAAGRITKEDIMRSLKTGERELVGKTMPAKGLTLIEVEYGINLFGNQA